MYVWRKYKNMAWPHMKSLTKVSSGEGTREGKGAKERMKLSLPEVWVLLVARSQSSTGS